jgi:DNA-binding XRE family transcriptional regulator
MPNKMKEKRFFSGLSQWEIALGTAMSQTRISLIERDFICPTDLDKLKIAKILKCKLEEVFPMGTK